MTARLDEIRRIFAEVVDLPPAARPAALDRLAADAHLRSEVEALLRSHDLSELLASPTVTVPPALRSEGPGTVIGAYKLLQVIGEGGFGAVYMAEQESPVRRKVALKIIKLGMDTRQVIARFEAERQALAMMEHPNIAKVLDAGATETGRPYFVMELVRGVPITEYCDTNKLPARERLGLFIDVCHAVQHAHQKGVIHRDIKPSNVLVTLHDGRPVPKVIDFGIAKATSLRLTDKTLFTEFRQFIGTPEYMSPEQAEMSGLDVDTRADIYSLGVLLYELLTGTTPFDAQTLRNQGLERIQKVIRESEPPRPSTRVDTLASTPGAATTTSAADVARQRQTDPAALGRLLRGDLDWIVMRAIEKDRTRRYETATSLAADVHRYLSDQPVEAGPPSTVYRLRKFAKRNRAWLVPTGLAAGALALAFVGVVYGLVEATRGRAAAVRAQGEAETARGETAAALGRARRESDRNRQIGEYLQDAVSGASSRDGRTQLLPLAAVLDRGRELFGGDHAVIGSALLGWASARQLTGDPTGAEPALIEAAEMFARLHGPSDPRVTNARLLLARAIAAQPGRESEAEAAFRAVADAYRLNPGPTSTDYAVALEAITSHVLSRGGTGREEEITALWSDSVRTYDAAFGPMDVRSIREMAQYGQWLQLNGRKEQAVPVLEEAIRRGTEAFRDGDPALYMAVNSMILLEWAQNGDWRRAAEWYDRLIALGDRMPAEYAQAGVAMRLQVAGFWAQAGDDDLAAQRLEEFLEARSRPGFETDWQSAARIELSMEWLTELLDARPDLGRRVQIARAEGAHSLLSGMTAPPAETLHQCGAWLADHGFASDAGEVLTQSVARYRALEPPNLAGLQRALASLGECLIDQSMFDEAEPPLRESLALVESSADPSPAAALELRLALAECFLGRGRLDEARRALDETTSAAAAASPDLAAAHAELRRRLDAAQPGR